MAFNNIEHKALAKSKKKSHKKKLERLKTKKDGEVDVLINNLHEEVFENIDCLQCANCCTTTGPLFKQKDIDRISKHLGQTPGNFIDQYLRIDEEHDYVLQSLPCTFLGKDNYCSIYDVAPKACRTYPHTDSRKQKPQFKGR